MATNVLSGIGQQTQGSELPPPINRGYSAQDSLTRRTAGPKVTLNVFTFDESKSFSLQQVERFISAKEIVQLVLAQLCPVTAQEEDTAEDTAQSNKDILFSLWMVSECLELQLKSYHEPVKLYRKWSELLTQYTTASKDKCASDKPRLFLRRNAFLDLKKEQEIVRSGRFPEGTNLLYHEALYNSTKGNYPTVSCTDAADLAVCCCAIKHGDFDLKAINAVNFIPCRVRVSSGGKAGTKIKSHDQLKGCDIDEALEAAHSSFKGRGYRDKDQIKIQYLEKCWATKEIKDFYGSVIFHALVERKRSSSLINYLVYRDRPVIVAVNLNSIHIINESDKEVMLHIKMSHDLKCEFQPATEEGEHFYSSVWLEFNSPSNIENHVQRLQIFSRQAPLIDAMINRSLDEALGRGVMSSITSTVQSVGVAPEESTTSTITSSVQRNNACTDSTKAFVCQTYVCDPKTGDKVKMSALMSIKNSLMATSV